VEIAKKEWPQLWPNLLENLVKLSETSNAPFLVLRRLVEDVVTLGVSSDFIESLFLRNFVFSCIFLNRLFIFF